MDEALQVVRGIEGEIAAVEARKPAPLGEREREQEQLMRLGVDLELAWSHPAATSATRKRIMRAALTLAIGGQTPRRFTPCVRAAATTPVQRLGVVRAHLTQP